MASRRWFAGFPRQYHYVFRLHLPAGTHLHSDEASQAARAVSASIFGSTPARWKLEEGEGGGPHLHAVSPLPPVAVFEFEHAGPVWNLRGLLDYLAKPASAALCRLRLTPWTPDAMTRRRAAHIALEGQAAARRDRLARGKRRLPPVMGWTGRVMNLGPRDVFRCALLLALQSLALAALLGATASAVTEPSPTPTPGRRERPRPAQSQIRPRAPERSTRGLGL